MKRASTNFLRFAIFLIGIIVLALSIFFLPTLWRDGSAEFPQASYALQLIVLGMYATTIPFFIALWQTLKLLKYIDRGTAFSEKSIEALKNIKYCAIIISVLYVGGEPLLFPIADADDAPGLLIIGAIVACAPIAVSVFTAILQKLLQSALDIKSENDLTV